MFPYKPDRSKANPFSDELFIAHYDVVFVKYRVGAEKGVSTIPAIIGRNRTSSYHTPPNASNTHFPPFHSLPLLASFLYLHDSFQYLYHQLLAWFAVATFYLFSPCLRCNEFALGRIFRSVAFQLYPTDSGNHYYNITYLIRTITALNDNI